MKNFKRVLAGALSALLLAGCAPAATEGPAAEEPAETGAQTPAEEGEAPAEDGAYVPKIKISETAEKITIPHLKNLYRIYDTETGKAMADLITMHDEELEGETTLTLFDPVETWKKRTFTNIRVRRLNTPIYQDGRRVYQTPPLEQIKQYCAGQVDTLWDEVKRFENPHRYYVDLSQRLWDERQKLLNEYGASV